MTPPMDSTSVIGSPSSKCECNGHAAMRAVQCLGSRSFFSAWSPEEMNTVTDQVPASLGTVRSANEWKYVRSAPRQGGTTPVLAKEPRVIDESGVLGLLNRTASSDGLQPVREFRPSSHC